MADKNIDIYWSYIETFSLLERKVKLYDEPQ